MNTELLHLSKLLILGWFCPMNKWFTVSKTTQEGSRKQENVKIQMKNTGAITHNDHINNQSQGIL